VKGWTVDLNMEGRFLICPLLEDREGEESMIILIVRG